MEYIIGGLVVLVILYLVGRKEDKPGNTTNSGSIQAQGQSAAIPYWDDTHHIYVFDILDTTVKIKWDAPNHEASVSNYQLSINGSNVRSYAANTRKVTLKGLQPATRYQFDLVALTASGAQSSSSLGVQTFTLPAGTAGTPDWADPQFKTFALSGNSLQMVWNDPGYGAQLAGYRVFFDGEKIAELNAQVNSYDLRNIGNGNHQVNIQAKHASGGYSANGPMASFSLSGS